MYDLEIVFLVLVRHQTHERQGGPLETTPFDYISMKKSPHQPPPPQLPKHLLAPTNSIASLKQRKEAGQQWVGGRETQHEHGETDTAGAGKGGKRWTGEGHVPRQGSETAATTTAAPSSVGGVGFSMNAYAWTGHGIQRVSLLQRKVRCRSTLESPTVMVDD